MLQEMCKEGFPDIKRKFIDVFSKFLQNARLLSTEALHQLFSRASSICHDNDNGKYVQRALSTLIQLLYNLLATPQFYYFDCSIENISWKVYHILEAQHPLR